MYIFKGFLQVFILILSVYIINCDFTEDSTSNKTKTLFECLRLSRSGRIVGGYNAKKNDLPYIVSLNRRGAHVCGATVLNERWLLTAAHCLCNGFNEIIPPNNLKGLVGLHRLSEFNENTEYNSRNQPFQINFKTFIPHPDYQCTKVQHDIALIEISKPLKFSDQVQPACIDLHLDKDNTAYAYDHLVATVSGWGWTHENQIIGDRPDILQSADVQIWDSKECQETFKKHHKNLQITELQLCAGYKDGGIDACWADSGGPLILDDILIGVVSTGIGCGRKDTPGIYTRVNKYINWIETLIT